MSAAAPPNPWGYSPEVWRLFLDAPHAGAWPEADSVLTGEARARAGRGVLRLQLRVGAGRVEDARFQAYGCPTTIAVGAWLAAQARGRAPADLRTLDAARIRGALEIPDDRAHCALVGEDALKAVLSGLPT